MFLGIDCGTQGTKALVVDEQGAAHGRGHAAHALIQRPTGAREQEPTWWIDAVRTAIQQALAQASAAKPGVAVQAIAVSGQQHGLVVLDEHMQVIRPAKLWNDTETAPENAELVEMLGGPEACFARFGIIPLTGYTVSKLLWLKKHEPENFAKIRHILLPHDYINLWLTGRLAAEYGDASGTGFFDVRTRRWAPEVLAAIDGGTGQLEAALPPLYDERQFIGPIRAEIAAELGLSPSCLVATGGGDNMMGAIGTGNVTQGVVTMSLGTSATVYSFATRPQQTANISIAPFCSSSGGWLPLICTMNATNVVTQTLDVLSRTVADIEPSLTASTPGAGGLVFLPFLNGERTPDLPTAQGTLRGVTASNFTAPNLIRAAIEGASFGLLNGLDLILDRAHLRRIVLIGGGARSAQWRQLLADASGVDIHVPVEEESGCLGAAMQAQFAWSYRHGTPGSFADICGRSVRLDETKTAIANPALRAQYDEARAAYGRELKILYGV